MARVTKEQRAQVFDQARAQFQSWRQGRAEGPTQPEMEPSAFHDLASAALALDDALRRFSSHPNPNLLRVRLLGRLVELHGLGSRAEWCERLDALDEVLPALAAAARMDASRRGPSPRHDARQWIWLCADAWIACTGRPPSAAGTFGAALRDYCEAKPREFKALLIGHVGDELVEHVLKQWKLSRVEVGEWIVNQGSDAEG